MRATSSMMSSSPSTSLVARKDGTVMVSWQLAVGNLRLVVFCFAKRLFVGSLSFFTSNSRDFRILMIWVSGILTPILLQMRSFVVLMVSFLGFAWLMSTIGEVSFADGQSFNVSSIARWIANSGRAGSRLFSKRWTDSVRRPRAAEVLRTQGASKLAASKIISVVSSWISES